MFAILKREVKAYFQTVTGWLFIAAVLVLYGLYFYVYNLRAGYPYISYSLSAIAFIMLIAVPVLTMRSFAEERHSRTDQLILTAPVSVGKVVLGKYLAMAFVFTIDMVIIAITPLLLMSYGTIPLGESYAAVLGFWLYGCACIAVGMFISSLTESQVISAVLTFVALFAGYMMGSICNLISESGNLLTKILGCYDLYTPLDNFMNGTLDVAGIVYYVTIIALLLFLTGQSVQKRRWSISSKKISTGVFSTGMIIAMVAVTVVVNLFVAELPATWTSIDVTSTKIYSITDDTKDYLKGLDEDVTIYVLVSDASKDTKLDETLQRYESLSDHIKVSYINPAANPTFAAQYTDSSVTSNSMIVVSSARSRVIDYKKKNVLNLVKYYAEKNDAGFRTEAYEIAKDFDNSGDYQLAEYIMSLLSNANTFVPQISENRSAFFEKIDSVEDMLLLPDCITQDLLGVVNAVGRKMGINKFLFQGKPGTGKTEAVKQLARILNREIFMVDFSAIIDSKLGQTQKNLTEMFKEINSFAHPEKVVVLFDEIDALALERTSSNDLREMGRVTSTLLKCLDRMNENIILVATTNLYDMFDKALTRRFDSIIDFNSQTEPLIEYYKKQGVYHEIDGLQEIGKVYADVKASLGALK